MGEGWQIATDLSCGALRRTEFKNPTKADDTCAASSGFRLGGSACTILTIAAIGFIAT
eukprot:gene11975-35502_t